MTRARTVVQEVIGPPAAAGPSLPRVLGNERWEKFSNLLAQGETQYKAYAKAGFGPNSRSAAKLANNPVIMERVRQLQELAIVETTLTIKRVLDELEKIGFANMLDYIKIGEDGQPELNFTGLTREKAAAIGEITTEELTNPRTGEVTRRTKFKLLDKKGALVDIGKYLGMWVDRRDIRVGGVMLHMTPSDMAL